MVTFGIDDANGGMIAKGLVAPTAYKRAVSTARHRREHVTLFVETPRADGESAEEWEKRRASVVVAPLVAGQPDCWNAFRHPHPTEVAAGCEDWMMILVGSSTSEGVAVRLLPKNEHGRPCGELRWGLDSGARKLD